MAAMLHESVAIMLTHPQAVLLAITMRKSTHGIPFVSHMIMGLRLAARSAIMFSLVYFLVRVNKLKLLAANFRVLTHSYLCQTRQKQASDL